LKSAFPLRLAALLALCSTIFHTYLFEVYDPMRFQDDLKMFKVVQSDYDKMFGMLHSYMDFYVPFGIFVIFATLLECAIIWQMAWIESAIEVSMRPLTIALMLAEGGYAYLMWQSGFSYALLLHMMMTLLLAVAATMGGAMKAKVHWSEGYKVAMRGHGNGGF
jgi:hypothetical protein